MATARSADKKPKPDAPAMGPGRLPAGKTRRIGSKDPRHKLDKQLNVSVTEVQLEWANTVYGELGKGLTKGQFVLALMREAYEARTQPARVQISEKAASAGDLSRAEGSIQERFGHLDEALTVALQQNRHLFEAVKTLAGQLEALTNQVGLNTRTLLEMRPAIGRSGDAGGSQYPKKTKYGEG